MTTAVVYASRYGSTSDIAHHIARQLGSETVAFDLADGQPDLSDCGLVVLGTPVYLGRPLGLVEQFVRSGVLDGRPVALFVGGLETDPDKQAAAIGEAFPSALVDRAVAVGFLGGRLLSSRVGMTDRFAFKRATGTKIRGDVDAVDHDAIDRFVAQVRHSQGTATASDEETRTGALS